MAKRHKIEFEHLDIPIIRSCNLGCQGCLTFSNSKQVKGLVKLEESHGWLKHWSEKIEPWNVAVFGGEPLLHPKFVDWCLTLKQYWPKTSLKVYTNGYYLHHLFDEKIMYELFRHKVSPTFVVSIQTGHEPYYTQVKDNIEKFKNLIQKTVADKYSPDQDISWHKFEEDTWSGQVWWHLKLNGRAILTGFSYCEQFRMPWQSHYRGSENHLKPNYSYNANWYKGNHEHCQAKSFINLYEGRLYKCPTTAVLEHTLDTFGIKHLNYWKPYVDNYKFLDTSASDDEIAEWFKRQESPEQVCNMCGFVGPNNNTWRDETDLGHLDDHAPKEGWQLK